MTLTQSMQLGDAGQEIMDAIHEIRHAVNNNETICGMTFDDTDDDVYSLNEYVEDTLDIIQEQLTKLA